MQKLTLFLLGLTLLASLMESTARAQWVPAGLPGQDSVDFVISLGSLGSYLFAGTGTQEGVWRSTDNGASCALADSGFTEDSIRINAGCFLAVGADLFAASDGVWLSTDSGTSWTCTMSASRNEIGSVLALALSGTTLFAGYEAKGVSISTNDGKSWTSANNGLTDLGIAALAVSGQEVFAGTGSSGVFATTDNGKSWVAVNNGLPSGASILCLATLGTTVFASVRTEGVFLSTNDGASWERANTGISSGADVLCFAISGTILLAGSTRGFYFSTNNGTSWAADNEGLSNPIIWALAVIGTNIFGGISGGPASKTIGKLALPILGSVSSSSFLGNHITAYPNPTTHSTTLHFTGPAGGYATVSVVNALGVCVMHNAYSVSRDGSVTLDLSGLSAGMYECVVQTDGKEMCVPILVE